MSYIMINGDDTHYEASVVPFTTQHGHNAIRFVGAEIPETDQGFKMFDDNDELVTDFSDYKYLYRPNEYSVENDEIIYPAGSDQPLEPSAYDRLSSRVSRVSSQVAQITPFEETKKAYYGEIEKVFYYVPEGNTTIFFTNYTGEYEVVRTGDRLTVKFPERLSDVTDITIMVNK